MLVRSFLPELAAELGLRMIAPLPGGTLGAALVADREGQEFVLKADPTNTWRERFARGAQFAEELRLRGYPAPLHVATGVALDAAWSLQERLRGAMPGPLSAAHAQRLVALARMHADAATMLSRSMTAAAPSPMRSRGYSRGGTHGASRTSSTKYSTARHGRVIAMWCTTTSVTATCS